MKRRLIPALALLAATAMPALAADDAIPDPLAANWQEFSKASGNLRNGIVLMMQQNQAQQERIRTLTEQCGDKCKPAPEAKAEPVHPVPPGQ